jgi:hypothetical protein
VHNPRLPNIDNLAHLGLVIHLGEKLGGGFVLHHLLRQAQELLGKGGICVRLLSQECRGSLSLCDSISRTVTHLPDHIPRTPQRWTAVGLFVLPYP